MYLAHENALKQIPPVAFTFRGVVTTLYPDQHTVDDDLIDIRLSDVLKEANKISNVSSFISLFLLRFITL